MADEEAPLPRRASWLEQLEQRRTVVNVVATALIVTSILLSGLTDWPNWLKTILLIIATIAGAALGAFLQGDKTGQRLRSLLPSSVRQLLDHISLLRQIIVVAREARLEIEQAIEAQTQISPERVAQVFRMLEYDARSTIRSAQSAVQTWADIDRVWVDQEIDQYVGRQKRMSDRLGSNDE